MPYKSYSNNKNVRVQVEYVKKETTKEKAVKAYNAKNKEDFANYRKQYLKEERQKRKAERALSGSSVSASSAVKLFCYILILMLLATVLRGQIINGTLSTKIPTFESLLNLLQSLPQGSISMNVVAEITADWGWDAGIFYISFNWLRDFINLYIYSINAFIWLGSNLIYVFKFIGIVIKWLFVG